MSSNDGCVIARSQEVKDLGIPMGAAFFEYKDLIVRHNVVVRSSNFALYADMSARIMSILEEASSEIEFYSIDEAFMDFRGLTPEKAMEEARKIRSRILQYTGIPVSIGLGATKTLAKLANFWSKKTTNKEGVTFIPHGLEGEVFLKNIPMGEIWGIGRQYSKLLERNGLWNAYDFVNTSSSWIQKQMGIMGLRVMLELQGTSCLPLDDMIEPRKSIIVSRSFGHRITHFQELSEAVALYAHRASEKLRQEGKLARKGSLFLQVKSGAGKSYRHDVMALSLERSTNDCFALIGAAQQALKTLFKPGTSYKKAGIMLYDFCPIEAEQLNFLAKPKDPKIDRLMGLMDHVNRKHGKETLFSASIGTQRLWRTKTLLKSPHYTTDWKDLLKVKAD